MPESEIDSIQTFFIFEKLNAAIDSRDLTGRRKSTIERLKAFTCREDRPVPIRLGIVEMTHESIDFLLGMNRIEMQLEQ